MEEVKKEEKETPNRSVLKNFKSTYKYAKSGRKYLWLFLATNVIMTIISVVAPILGAQAIIIKKYLFLFCLFLL